MFIDPSGTRHANLSGAQHNAFDVYIACASILGRSIKAAGSSLILLTNDRSFVDERSSALKISDAFRIQEIEFTRNVPQQIPFYAAHFKLDVLKYFGQHSDRDILCLLDSDAVMLSPLKLEKIHEEELLVYDITGEFRGDHGRESMSSDISSIGGRFQASPRWYGGEFILGRSPVFRRLSAKIDHIWPIYCSQIGAVRHVGDEMVVNAALSMLDHEITLIDAGSAGHIKRWWTARTNIQQDSFSTAAQSSILHLPSDKLFFVEQSQFGFQVDEFLSKYKYYAAQKLRRRRAANQVLNWIRSTNKFVATMD